MSAIKFQIGKPRKLTLGFDTPKTGTNNYGNWYMYGFKNGDLSSEEDCFFATDTLHAMIQTLGAKEGDEVDIEKCQDGDITFFKVNNLTMDDMKRGGAFERVQKAKPKSSPAEQDVNEEEIRIAIEKSGYVNRLKAKIKELELEIASLKKNQLTDNDIPF